MLFDLLLLNLQLNDYENLLFFQDKIVLEKILSLYFVMYIDFSFY